MKISRQISHNWEKYQVNILRQFNIEVKEGNCRFNMNDANTYSKLASFFRDWDVLDTLGFEFTKNEILTADFCVLTVGTCLDTQCQITIWVICTTLMKQKTCAVNAE